MKAWLKQIENWPGQAVVLASIILVILVGFLDYFTGYETFFFTFYLIPIFWATWRTGAAHGILISALSVAAWVSSNIEAGQRYSNYFIPVWNAGIMFAIYLIIVFLLSRLKKNRNELEERVRLRTDALTREMHERVRLQKEVLETTDREQRRIGRELHDGLCQHLTGTALAGHFLEQKLTARSPADAGEASRLVQLVEQAIELTRNLSHELDPVELKSGKLTDHLEDLAKATSQRFKIICRFECRASQVVDNAAIATHLYRIALAAVNQAAQPGRARQIIIGLDSAVKEVMLSITDDGKSGLETAQPDTAAVMRTMAYRADLIGATFRVEHAAGCNRVVCVLSPEGSRNA